MVKLTPIRAADHRAFIGPEFGAGPDGEDPQALSYADIIADPKLAALARRVYDELRDQFSQPDSAALRAETDEEEAYRIRLEGVADMLEILLDETLEELETLNSARRAPTGEI